MNRLSAVSLFAGVGGIDLAARRAGIETRLLCEIDKPCRQVLARHFPEAVIHDDVRTLTADDLRRDGAVPDRTVVFAGFPCQDVSVAGRRKGMGEGTRTGLFWHVDRLLAEFRPAWVVLENVAGLLSATCACPGDGRCGADCAGEEHQVKGGACGGECIARHGGVMGAVLGSLANRGYGFAYRVLDAQYTGVPQRRRRVVIVGHLGGTGAAPAEILFEPESSGGDSAAGRTAGARIAPTLESGTNGTGGTRPPGTTVDTAESLIVTATGGVTHALTAEGSDASEDGTTRQSAHRGVPSSDEVAGGQVVVTALTTRCGNTQDDQQTGQLVVSALDTQQGGPDDNAAQGGHLIAFHLTQDPISGDVAPAMGTGNAQGCATIAVAFVENQRGEESVRRLTPLECERLQGFPDNWTDGQSDAQRYKQMGNSVAVPVFTWTLRRLAAVDARLAERAA